MSAPSQRSIVLIGFMGAGKSAVGRLLAERTGRRFVDTDDLVEQAAGTTVAEIFRAEGEEGFRRRERGAVAAAASQPGTVIAAGGGAVLDPANVRLLRRHGVVVHLDVDPSELARRLDGTGTRPLLDEAKGPLQPRIERILSGRADAYARATDLVVDANPPAAQVAETILRRLGLERSRMRASRVTVEVDAPYDVVIGRGLLLRAGDLVDMPDGAERAAVVTHPRVWTLWGEPLAEGLAKAGVAVVPVTFPAGERHKTLRTVERLYRAFARAKLHRSDVVVALGGGVAGDVAGYAAATYMRGMRVVQVPTTLLAMVDAAIGGKTGVNLEAGKNLVGAFHQPVAVLADLDTLSTLPERELRGGLAEVVKYACIADPGIGALAVRKRHEVFGRGKVLAEVVERSARVKADVVAQDERETGTRAVLNYGHTLGHALEAASVAARGRPLHHGEAIAVGMHFAARLSVELGMANPTLVDEHLRLLDAAGLPTTVRRLPMREVARYMAMDKKYARGLRFVLLEEMGRPVIRGEVPQGAVRRALGAVTR